MICVNVPIQVHDLSDDHAPHFEVNQLHAQYENDQMCSRTIPLPICADKTNRQSCLSSLLYVTRLDRQVFLANASFLENSMNTYQQVQDIPSFSYSGGDIGG